jgi:hypothetical protein
MKLPQRHHKYDLYPADPYAAVAQLVICVNVVVLIVMALIGVWKLAGG